MTLPAPRRIFTDSAPVAGIMLFWIGISWLGTHPMVGLGARVSGLILAILYTTVHGVRIAESIGPLPSFTEARSLLRINGIAILAAAGWFFGAWLLLLLEQVLRFEERYALPADPTEGVAFALVVTGVMTVGLYAVALAVAGIRYGVTPASEPRPASGGSLADD